MLERRAALNLLDAAGGARCVPAAASRWRNRSALSYYLTGEILRALVACGGDLDAACRSLAVDDPPPQLVARARRVVEALRESGGDAAKARRRFGKLPPEYDEALERAVGVV